MFKRIEVHALQRSQIFKTPNVNKEINLFSCVELTVIAKVNPCDALVAPQGLFIKDYINITAKYYSHLDLKRKRALGNTIGNSIGFKNNM